MAGETILIVEDNERNLKLARDVLRFHGYQTIEARSAEEGLELARTRQPALVLMDIQLPGMDGIQALRRLRDDPATRRIPVLALTASAMSHDRARIREAGFDGYLPKPISLGELVAEIERLLDAATRAASDAPAGDPGDGAG